jgi:hypothetical protein
MTLEVLLVLRVTFQVSFNLRVKDYVHLCLMVNINHVPFAAGTYSAENFRCKEICLLIL